MPTIFFAPLPHACATTGGGFECVSTGFEGFEVIECATEEAAGLIVATTGTELQAIVADNNLAGEKTGATLASYALHLHPGMNIVIMSNAS